MKLFVGRFLLFVSVLPTMVLGSGETIVDMIMARSLDDQDPDSTSLFRDALQECNMLDAFLGDHTADFTVFAPTNRAIWQSPEVQLYMIGLHEEPYPRWHQNLKNALKQHILVGQRLNHADIFDLQRDELVSLQDPITINQFEFILQDQATIIEQDVQASNGVFHVVDKVLRPHFFDQTFSQLELQSEFGPDHLDRVTMADVVDNVGAREMLGHFDEQGRTFVGCRIRAFNTLDTYLEDTVNGSPNGVIHGEFLNDTVKEETTELFIEYSIIPKNYYNEDIPDNNRFIELTVPIANCGHMWVTKRDGKLCFNNGCVVDDDDDFREYTAANGVGYVLDKCQVCHGVAMLVDVASLYTMYNLEDNAQLLGATEWNMRDVRLSVGNGTDVTLFASINTGWDFFNRDDTIRIVTPKWKRHLLNLMEHTLIQGIWTKEKLLERYHQVGPYELMSLAGEPIPVGFNHAKGEVTVAGGELFFPNIQGPDGMVHLSNQLPLPISVTKTIYDIANDDPNYSTQILYTDSVRLSSDLRRLLPMTALYANNTVFDNVVTPLTDIAEKVLKNHMFAELLWCDTLIEMAGNGTVMSLNQRNWTISVENGFPCFTAENPIEGVGKACVSKCDILARNGIVHFMDYRLEYEVAETAAPGESGTLVGGGTFTGNSGGGGGGGNPNTPFVRPTGEDDSEVSFGTGKQSGAASASFGAASATTLLFLYAILL